MKSTDQVNKEISIFNRDGFFCSNSCNGCGKYIGQTGIKCAVWVIDYCSDINVQIPVWEKLAGKHDYQISLTGNGNYATGAIITNDGVSKSGLQTKVGEAVARATLRAIEEFRK